MSTRAGPTGWMRLRRPVLVMLGASLPLTLGSYASPAAEFVPLGFLPGGNYSVAYGISADGSTVVGASNTSSPQNEAFRWTASGGMTGLGFLPGGVMSTASGASADGSTIVGTSDNGAGNEAFRWTAGGGMVGLGAPQNYQNSGAVAVSADGSTIVGAFSSDTADSSGGTEAYRWSAATGMTGLGFLPGSNVSQSFGVSTDGSTVVGGSLLLTGAWEGFRWTPFDLMTNLGGGVAFAISADGSTVVGGGGEAFAWTSASGMVGLGELPGGSSSSTAYAVSADGSMIVGFANTAAGQEAFVWDAAHGMRPLDQVLASLGLDLTGWTLTNAWGISDDGKTLTGTGINPNGQHEGWVAVIPEPGTAWLLGVGLVPLVGASIRKRAKRSA